MDPMKLPAILTTLAMVAFPAAAQASDSYVGAFASYSASKPDYQEPNFPDYSRNPLMSGVAGGVYAGHDFISTGVHVGIEGDFGWVDNSVPNDPTASFNTYTSFKAKWNAHVRARAAVPIGTSTKLFAAGGVAFLNLDSDDTDPGWGHFERTYTGWTLGGGIEHSLSEKLVIRIEYLHDDYGAKFGNIDDTGSPGYDVRLAPRSDAARVGLAIKF